ncbi:LSU ribosomal protein L5P [Abditibacterium utsteinense]|uniref:Large ribosomal subunit protein uL5 n=1 Tax=Abditibacterium utsteinense TaxID=1960156 RepID=A0A2S8ST29_9BACT|nr:50S ribosomal protein L5 [Abditibacterium utsteinense]PQV63955.1 LSU ribosomal protein L5P [Abditibacterium utsteinense]
MKPHLQERYESQVKEALQKQFGYDNPMQLPRLQKIVVNMGVGDAREDSKLIDAAAADLAVITGQKPAIRRAKKSIANFKLREGMPIGCMVTLRGERMWEFMYRLIHAALPRIRDFQGIPDRSFDGRGNYTFGVREQLIFPEINADKVTKTRGMDITFVTSAKTDDEARVMLRELGLPMRKRGDAPQ